MGTRNPEGKKDRLGKNWLKKAAAVLCSAALIVGLAQGLESLDVLAEDDTKTVTMEVRFVGDTTFGDNAKRAARAYMGANNLVLKVSGTTTSYTSNNKECVETEWESNGYVTVKYTVIVPKDIQAFISEFTGEKLTGIITTAGDTDITLSEDRYGCYFVDGDRLLNSAYYRQGSDLPEPTPPTKAGYVFQRWVTSDKGNTDFDFSAKVTSVRTAYASWQDWSLDGAGRLTISSQDGMDDWSSNATEDERARVKSVEIKEDVTEIRGAAFEQCEGIDAVYLRGKTPPLISAGMFDDCKFMSDGRRGLVVPGDSIDAYKEANQWKDYVCYMTQYAPTTAAHDYLQDWQTDDKNHWHECEACGTKANEAEHEEDGGTVTEEPTETDPGLMTYKCRICAYVTRTEEIPVIVNPGVIDKEVKKRGEVPSISIATSIEGLQSAVLTASEKEQAEKGTDITIRLTVENAKDSVSEKDKELIEGKLDGYQVGEYLDISLEKLIGADSYQVEEVPGGSIRLVIQVPGNLKNTDSTKVRNFRIIRVHAGEASVLYDIDDNEDTVTIDTDRFSTYALVYQDNEKDPDNPNPGQDPGTDNPGTNNSGGGNSSTGNTGTTNPNTRNTNTSGTNGSRTTSPGTTNTTTGTGTSNQAKGNALRTGDVAPVGFYTAMALCFLAVMIALERKQQLDVIRLIRRTPRPY